MLNLQSKLKYTDMKPFLLILLSFLYIELSFSQENTVYHSQGVPIMHITLNNGKELKNITKEIKLDATMRIENANGSNFNAGNLYNGNIRIKGRGNSSWNGSDKKSYSIDLTNSQGKKNEIPLLGMAKDEDWVLNACYFDKTLLRNYITFYLANAMGNWAAHAWFVELFVNGEYRGIYMLCENVKKGKQRVNIKDIGNDELSITGGYLFEQDYPQRLKAENSKYITSSRVYNGRYYHDTPETDSLYFGFKYPKDEDRTPEQTKYISDYIAAFEEALYGNNFQDPIEGYRKYVDVQSFVDWYVITELSLDWDHTYFLSSVFFHKQQGEKLKIGPIWDFDVAYKTSDNRSFLVRNNMPWIKRMWEDEEFKKMVAQRFIDMIPILENTLTHFDDVAKDLTRYGAVDRNFEKWPILGQPIWTDMNEPIPDTYDGELRRLTQWIRERFVYIAYRSQESGEECNALINLKPRINILDQDKFDNGILPLAVQTGYISSATKYIWNNIELSTRDYTITDYGKFWVKIKVNGCESQTSDTLYVKPKAEINLSRPEYVYDGNPKSIGVSTNPVSLPVQITYNGSTDLPIEVGNYHVVATIDDKASYQGKQSSFLTITKAQQTIDFELPENIDLSKGYISLHASATSELPVTFRIINGEASIANSILSFNKTGIITIEASQNGNSCYNAAEPIQKTIIITQATGIDENPVTPFFKAYPNPATDLVNIIFDKPGRYIIKLMDMSGKTWITQTTENPLTQINTSAYPQGIYILQIESVNSKKQVSQKILITK